MKRFFWLLLFLPSLLAANPIVVHLRSANELESIYLDPIFDHFSGFETSYLQTLEQILAFDLNHNGKTKTAAQDKKRRSLAQKERKLGFVEWSAWHKLETDYVLKLEVNNKQLVAHILNTHAQSIKAIDGLFLTGSLPQDRRQVHKLADALCQALYNKAGIADRRILYTVRTRDGEDADRWTSEVWEADYDGANAHCLTRDNALCVTPTFVPNRKGLRAHHFLYVSYKIGQPKIMAASLAEGMGRRLTYLHGNQLMPAFSPQKDRIAFVCDITGNPDLFVQDFSIEQGLVGKPRQIFAASNAAQGSPTFSPDGERIAFVSNKDGTPRIYVMGIPPFGTPLSKIRPTMLTKENRNNTAPAWSPDGTKIAYCALTQGVRQIWYYDIHTGKEIQLTEGPGHKENPAWAPNSLHLLFNSETTSGCELYLTNLNQPEAVKISRGAGEKRFPNWEPYQL